MDWNNVTVNPVAAGLVGIAWQWARGTGVPHWLSATGAAVVTAVAYVATVRPPMPADFYAGADLGMHLLVWLGLAFGIGRALKGAKVGPVTLVPVTKTDA